MNDVMTQITAIGSAPLVLGGLVVLLVVRKIMMGLLLVGFGLVLGSVAFFLSQS